MRSELRTGLAACLVSLLLATVVALAAGLGLAGGAAAEGPSEEASATGTPESPTESASGTPSETPSGTPSGTPTGSPTGTPTGTPTGDDAVDVDDAQLRWGLNDESDGAAPSGFNFFSAGTLPDRGAGHSVTAAEWRQADGEVRIEKRTASGTYAAATWAGLTTDSAGRPLGGGRVGGHQIVWNGGTGAVDATAGRAVIRWTGSASVVYYSGLGLFTIADPVLTVSGGQGVLTATLSGYGSSQADPGAWVPLPPTGVTLADLGGVDLDADGGFSATPRYRGVTVRLPSGLAAQVRTGADWGAFPQSYVDFQVATGLSSYWYSSGGAADSAKVPRPLTVSYESDRPVAVPTPSVTARPVDEVTNQAVAPPTATATASARTADRPVAPPVGPAVRVPPPAPSAPQPSAVAAAVAVPAAHPVGTVLALTRADAAEPSAPVWPWAAGVLALLAAALVVLLPARPPARRSLPWRSRAAHQGAPAPSFEKGTP